MRNLSQLEQIAQLPKPKQLEFFAQFSDTELIDLFQSYEFKARPKQLFPKGNWRTWVILSGRGFGKSFVGANWVIHKAQTQKYPIALVGANAADVRDYMVELGESSILQQSPEWFKPEYVPSKRRLIFPNGVIAVTYSADKPDQLRGFNGNSAWIDELAKYRYATETWDNLNFTLRAGSHPQVLITTTPRPIRLIKELNADTKVIKTFGSTLENRSNLAPEFVKYIYDKYAGTRLGRQELEGTILTDVPGALWSYENLDSYRVSKAPDLKEIIIAIDPAVTATEDSNETGIMVLGVDGENQGYLLEDKSGVYTPNDWGNLVLRLFDEYKADYIVAEVNNGGDLVENNLQLIAKLKGHSPLPYKKVHATRGKYIRAQPISTLYEKGQIHHVGVFPELEDQLCTWLPGETSPDRLDALVWGFTKLFVKQDEVSTGESVW